MSPLIEVDESTDRTLEFAARIAQITKGQVIANLVADASLPRPAMPKPTSSDSATIAIFSIYDGHRTEASYDPRTKRVEITSGPLRGQPPFKTPSGAARAIVSHYKPNINSNRNGLTFWMTDDGSGRSLKDL